MSAAPEVPVVGLRQPCPCGSGRRYKACHGRDDARRGTRVERVSRPFAGLPSEPDWVALREVVPAATVPVRLRADAPLPADVSGRDVLVATVLPFGLAALVRQDNTVVVALQTADAGNDPAATVAVALTEALTAEPGTPVAPPADATGGPALSSLIDAATPFEVTVADGFGFWAEGGDDPQIGEAIERANAAAVPTARLSSVDAAYWCVIGNRHHLRWALPHDEEPLLDAMAKLHVSGADKLVDDSRFVGSFRACGLLIPVWDLPAGMSAADVEEPAAAYRRRLDEALADTSPLTVEQRGARAGLLNRQLTLR